MRLRIRVLLHALRKPFHVPPLKEGRRSAERRTTGSAPPQKEKPASVCGEHHRLSPANAGSKRRRPRLSAPHRGHAPRALPPTRFRAALPGITGSKREDPLRHQCSQHLAVRSRAGRSMPKTARIKVTSPIREPHPPHRSAVTGRRPFDGQAFGYVTVVGTFVKACHYFGETGLVRRKTVSHIYPHKSSNALARRLLQNLGQEPDRDSA